MEFSLIILQHELLEQQKWAGDKITSTAPHVAQPGVGQLNTWGSSFLSTGGTTWDVDDPIPKKAELGQLMVCGGDRNIL